MGDINEAMARTQPWQVAYAYAEAQARIVLDTLEPGVQLTTTELVDRMFTGAVVPESRSRVFKALAAAADRGMARYVTRGEPEKIGSVSYARRRFWHAPRADNTPAKSCCPTCRRPL